LIPELILGGFGRTRQPLCVSDPNVLFTCGSEGGEQAWADTTQIKHPMSWELGTIWEHIDLQSLSKVNK
jgi:hypothetical protein